jgi:hypothetical protein
LQFSSSQLSSSLARSSNLHFHEPGLSSVRGEWIVQVCTFLVRLSSFLPYSSYLPSLSSSHLTLVSVCSFPSCLPLPRSLPSFLSVPSSFVVLPHWTYSCPFLLSFPILIIYIFVPSHLALTLSRQSFLYPLSITSIASHSISSRSIRLFSLDSIAVRETHHLALSAHVSTSVSILCNCTLQLHSTTLSLLGELD